MVIRLKTAAEQGKLPHLADIENKFAELLAETGSVARISDLSARLTKENNRVDQSRVAFLCKLCTNLITIDENDTYYQGTALSSKYDEKKLKAAVDKVIDGVKNIGKPAEIDAVATEIKNPDAKAVGALARLSKQLAELNNRWGLIKWPMVNPKNIRDKIYVILYENGKYMHFSEISGAIRQSEFKRRDVTTQAIHNELIKDGRFVLVGRGIYALKEWGYKKGTVADVITDVLKSSKEPLHRDEIVQRVLKSRHVKETTILLNLQGKPQFKRVAKATYTLAEE